VWDLHYPPPAVTEFSYPISAVYKNTWREPRGPWVVPGSYVVRLTVDGKVYEQPLKVKMDPRVKTPFTGLQQQFVLSKQMYDGMAAASDIEAQVRAFRARLADDRNRAGEGVPVVERVRTIEAELLAIDGVSNGRRGGGRGAPPSGASDRDLSRLRRDMASIYDLLQEADAVPTTQVQSAVAELLASLSKLQTTWTRVKGL
jgi:hypothetical protein